MTKVKTHECLIYLANPTGSSDLHTNNDLFIIDGKKESGILKILRKTLDENIIESLRFYMMKLHCTDTGAYGVDVELIFEAVKDNRRILVSTGIFSFNTFRTEVFNKRAIMKRRLQNWLIDSMCYFDRYYLHEDEIFHSIGYTNHSYREVLLDCMDLTE